MTDKQAWLTIAEVAQRRNCEYASLLYNCDKIDITVLLQEIKNLKEIEKLKGRL